MNADTVLNVLTIGVVINAIWGARFNAVEREAKARQYGAPYVAYQLIMLPLVVGGYCLFAYFTGYWQFYVLAGAPFLIALGSVTAIVSNK